MNKKKVKSKKQVIKKKLHLTHKRKTKMKKSINIFSNETKKIKSGIKNLDNLIEGGFNKNSTNLLIGESGSGKSIFGVQFLLEGIKNNENCLFISFEEKRNSFYSNLNKIGINLERLEKQGKFFFLEYTPQKINNMLEEGGGEVETIVLTKDIKRMVIDSVTSFMLLFKDGISKKEATISLFNLLGEWDCTTLLTFDQDLSKDDESSKIIDLEADSVIQLSFIEKGKERSRRLEILKMRGTNHSLKKHNFSIGKNGVVIGRASR